LQPDTDAQATRPAGHRGSRARLHCDFGTHKLTDGTPFRHAIEEYSDLSAEAVPGADTPKIGDYNTQGAQRMIRSLPGVNPIGAELAVVSVPPATPS